MYGRETSERPMAQENSALRGLNSKAMCFQAQTRLVVKSQNSCYPSPDFLGDLLRRQTMSPVYDWTIPVSVATIPHAVVMKAIHLLGRSLLMTKFDGSSQRIYVTNNSETEKNVR